MKLTATRDPADERGRSGSNARAGRWNVSSRRLKWALAIGLVAALAVAASGVWAQTAVRRVGDAHNNLLRGTAKADILDGRGGNDRLFGLAGNDLLIGGRGRDTLVGGPGKDRLRCGAGRDVAKADANDVVADDCEVVTGLTTTTTTEPPPTQTNPPRATHARPGRYCGYTNEGKIICVTVAPNSERVTGYSLGAVVDCGSTIRTFSFAPGGPAPIQADLTFSRSATHALPDRTNLKNITVSYEVNGKFDVAGSVNGSLFLKRVSFDANGTHSDCTGRPTAWQAKVGP